MNEIEFSKEAREKLISGINKLAEAVGSTMGPAGKCVIIPDTNKYSEYRVTKDGVSVANAIYFDDPIENIGAQLIKKAAQKTLDEAGDGTTTSTVLASAFVNNLKDFNYKEVEEAFNELTPKILDELKKNSRKLKREEIFNVANISANGDIQIGNIIQQAYNHSNVIKVEEGTSLEDVLELKSGMTLPTSYLSKHFITNAKKQECEMLEPYIILVEGKVESLNGFEQVIKTIASQHKNLLIITEHVHENILRLLESNKLSNALNICVMKTPGFGGHRSNLISDLSQYTGASIIKDCTIPITFKEVGILKSCNIGKNESILIAKDEIDFSEYLDNLKENLKLTSEKYEKELLQQRINYLTGNLSIIKVGGKSDLEVSERKDRYDDAVLAVACALEEGIVEGGGLALYRVIPEDFELYTEIESKIFCSLWSPNVKIHSNGYVFGGNMFEQNIIDPLKVTRCALLNAISIAKTILSTEAIVLHDSQWKKN